jgi:hypothetical protein
MAYITLIALSILITFLLVKFIDKIVYVFGVLAALVILGFLIIPLNAYLGMKIAAWSFAILCCAATIGLFSGFLSLIIVTPIMILWKSLKGLFT